MGASYCGSLLRNQARARLGHAVHLICLPPEADLINSEGAIIRMPIRGREGARRRSKVEKPAGQDDRRQ